MSTSSTDYPWYKQVGRGEPLQQGDMLLTCPVFVPGKSQISQGDTLPGTIDIHDVLVMTQSCDLAFGKIDMVLVCAFHTLESLAQKNPFYDKTEGKEALRRGHQPSFHLLNKCEYTESRESYLVVDFRQVFGVHLSVLKDMIDNGNSRIRLLPPYREQLSQAFARFFMRVGLPVDIPAFGNSV